MALTTQLGAPGIDTIQEGKNTLNRFAVVEASAADPVSVTDLYYIQSFDVDDGAPESIEVFQQGGGDNRTMEYRKWKWSGTITVLKGKMPTVLAQLLNITWSTASDAAIPFKMQNDYPKVHWEAAFRQKDNTTHLYTIIIQDMVIDHSAFSNPMDNSDQNIPFHTYYPPLYIAQNVEMVYDVFTGDGSSTDFTLSSTPLSLLTASNHDDFFLNQMVSVKEKASSASTGTRKMSGYTYSGGVLTASTAPAAATLVQALYVKAAS